MSGGETGEVIGAGEAPRPAGRLERIGAALLDLLLLLILPALSRLVTGGELPGGRPAPYQLPEPFVPQWRDALLPAALLLVQWIALARTGRTFGAALCGLRTVSLKTVSRTATGTDAPGPGLLRALLLRPLPLLLGALILVSKGSLAAGGLFTAIACAAWLIDAAALLISGRALRDRLLRVETRQERAPPDAYEPARFDGAGLATAAAGLIATALIASGAAMLVARRWPASTEWDWSVLVAAVVALLGVFASGALAALRSRRFLVGELALLMLLLSGAGCGLLLLRVILVPPLQRFSEPGLLECLLYPALAYFAGLLLLVMGSAVGFMVAGDRGVDLSTRFERLVARRHLRLRWGHWLQLAVIATLAPIVVYGLLIWPLRAVHRLVKGGGRARPLPPTVFMGLLTVVGVMFGVMSLNVVLAVMGGFEGDLKEKILGTNAHGVVHRYAGDFSGWRAAEQTVRGVAGVQGVTPFVLAEVMITTDDAVAGSVLKGIDVATAGQVTDLARYIGPGDGRLEHLVHPEQAPTTHQKAPYEVEGFDRRGNPTGADSPEEEEELIGDEADAGPLPTIVIGREMAHALHVWIGDRVTVMNPLGELGPTGPIPRSRSYRVAAVFVSGMYEYDSKFAYIDLAEAQRFFRLGDAVTGLELRFADVESARPLVRRIVDALGGFPYVGKDWGEMNRNLFSALRLERVVMFILLSFQVLIACICVIATLVMLVVEKRREVATLKAMGARDGSIMKLFVLEGLIIGAIGTFYGSAAGLMFCKLIERFGVDLDPQVYYITRLPVVIEPSSFVAVGLVSMLLVFTATLYPARRGGSIAPVEGFRED